MTARNQHWIRVGLTAALSSYVVACRGPVGTGSLQLGMPDVLRCPLRQSFSGRFPLQTLPWMETRGVCIGWPARKVERLVCALAAELPAFGGVTKAHGLVDAA